MISGASSSVAGLLRLASRIICLIVIASFVVFVVDQTSSASTHQQNELNGGSAQTPNTSSAKHKSTLHRTLDETSDALTSPFAGLVSGSNSQWAIHGIKTLLALLIYGFGLSFLARMLRVRV
jgi:thiol:disulfide interchange protein